MATEQVRTWRHSRKGKITGVLVSDDGEWLTIRLTEDHSLNYVSDSSRRSVDEAGEVLTLRAAFMRETTPKQVN